jgi:hypothetical protein
MIPDVRCIGMKDMAPEQLVALLKVLNHALVLADESGNPDIFDEVFEDANDMVILFGATGIKVGLQVTLED